MRKTKLSASNRVVLIAIALVFLVLLVLYAALENLGRRAQARSKHDVTVTRKISEDDEVLHIDRTTDWHMKVDSAGIEFYRVETSGTYHLEFRGTDGKNALSAFNTFTKWTATARANHVEPSSKRISDCDFWEYHLGATINSIPCEFSYGYGEARLNAFTEKDIAKFSELLKQLPEANAERLAKESKAEQEQSLFK